MPNVQRVQVSDYRLTANIVKTFLEEKFPAIIGSYNLTNDNGFYKFNIPVGTNWEVSNVDSELS